MDTNKKSLFFGLKFKISDKIDIEVKNMINKQSICVFIFVGLMLSSSPVFANASTAERQTVFNNVTDYLATLGKSQQDKKEILQDRRDIRRETRLKNEARRKQTQTRKRMKAQEEAIMNKVRAQ